MIKEDYCSFEVAKLLEEKGFNEQCRAAYTNYGKIFTTQIQQYVTNVLCSKSNLWECTAPTHQMAMKWLRDEKNILLYVYPVINLPVKDDNTFHWRWDGKKKIYCAPHIGEKHNYESFEDAVEEALKYSLENLI